MTTKNAFSILNIIAKNPVAFSGLNAAVEDAALGLMGNHLRQMKGDLSKLKATYALLGADLFRYVAETLHPVTVASALRALDPYNPALVEANSVWIASHLIRLASGEVQAAPSSALESATAMTEATARHAGRGAAKATNPSLGAVRSPSSKAMRARRKIFA